MVSCVGLLLMVGWFLRLSSALARYLCSLTNRNHLLVSRKDYKQLLRIELMELIVELRLSFGIYVGRMYCSLLI
jgi:uncharacterized membrane protein